MLIVCKQCAARKEWRKIQHEKLADQTCLCGGEFTRLDCDKFGCKYRQFAKCKEDGYCQIRREIIETKLD